MRCGIMSDDGGVADLLGCLLAGFLAFWGLKIGCLLLALVVLLVLENIMHFLGG